MVENEGEEMRDASGILVGSPRPLAQLPPRTIDTFQNEGYTKSLTQWLPLFNLKPGEFCELPIGTKRNTVHMIIQRLRKRGYIEKGFTVRRRLGRLFLARDLEVRSKKLPPMFGEKLLRWVAKTEPLGEGEMIQVNESPSAARHAIKRLRQLGNVSDAHIVRVRRLRAKQPEVYLVKLSNDQETRKTQLELVGKNARLKC